MKRLQVMLAPVLVVLFLLGATTTFAESSAPYERHDQMHKMTGEAHESEKNEDSPKLKCACCAKKEHHAPCGQKAHGSYEGHERHHDCSKGDCDKPCGRHGKHSGGHGKGRHAGESVEDLEELFN